ncbi:MAG: flagellin lysine-N-methylase [Clostridia bacterium]|nr:flagellin lysine-N-methylase [Clostridia bacterium]
MDYLIPDYYTAFHCKIGLCRSACCVGWPVTFSMADYFRLLGTQCSPELKRKLDGALHMTRYPREEEYGMLAPRYDGNCPLRLDDGRCGLQVEAGEEALPAVCRQYPRSIRPGECCCSNSCEAVIELLDREEPIRFHTASLKIPAPPAAKRLHFFETGGRELDIRLWLIGFVQDRRFSLGQRLVRLCYALQRMDKALLTHDRAAVDALLAGAGDMESVSLLENKAEALRIVRKLLERLDDLSDSIRDYGQQALSRFAREGDVPQSEILRRLSQASPHWEAWLENMLVNHMFFVKFPFQDRPVSLMDETVALCAVYALLRFLLVGAGNGTRERAVDIAAALFRLVDHTAFDRYAVPILKQLCTRSSAMALLML